MPDNLKVGGPGPVILPSVPDAAPKLPDLGNAGGLPPPAGDGFQGQGPLSQAAGTLGHLLGNAQAPAQGPGTLVSPKLPELATPSEVRERFNADYTAASRELLDHPDVDRSQTGARANEFFTQYARKFVETASANPKTEERAAAQERPMTRDQQQASAREFAESLRGLRFDQLLNAKTGKDGIENAFDLLAALDMKEFDELAANQEIVVAGEFPPLEKDAPVPPELRRALKKEIAEGPAEVESKLPAEQAEGEHDLPKLEQGAEQGPEGPGESSEQEATSTSNQEGEASRGRKGLGRNMLWNVLHTFRRNDETVRQEEEKWDRVVVAGLLFLLLVTILTVALVSL